MDRSRFSLHYIPGYHSWPIFVWRQMSPSSSSSLRLFRMAPGRSPGRSPGLGRLCSAWQAAGGSSVRRRKFNYRSCCPLCKQDKRQWYGQLRLNTTRVYDVSLRMSRRKDRLQRHSSFLTLIQFLYLFICVTAVDTNPLLRQIKRKYLLWRSPGVLTNCRFTTFLMC